MPAPTELIGRATRLASICEAHGVPLKAAAIQFPLAHPAVACVLTGARSPAELQENIRLFEVPVPGSLWEELQAEGLLDPRAPVPA
jgi:D-threo-aldose 1-dehydrogenase